MTNTQKDFDDFANLAHLHTKLVIQYGKMMTEKDEEIKGLLAAIYQLEKEKVELVNEIYKLALEKLTSGIVINL
jgi:hypothetical protein